MIIDGGEPWEGAVYIEGPGWVQPNIYDAACLAFTEREKGAEMRLAHGPTPVGQRLRAHTIPGRHRSAPEAMEWDETPDGDQDDTIEFDADLAFELRGDR